MFRRPIQFVSDRAAHLSFGAYSVSSNGLGPGTITGADFDLKASAIGIKDPDAMVRAIASIYIVLKVNGDGVWQVELIGAGMLKLHSRCGLLDCLPALKRTFVPRLRPSQLPDQAAR
jgi:hypothetical protein